MYIVEFSLRQRAFHKTTLKDMCDNNLRNVCRRFQADYVPIFASENEEEVYEFIRIAETEIKDYSMYRTSNGETVIPQH